MGANQEIIAELRRVLNERDEAREQLDLTKRELGRWVDRETKAARERDEARAELAILRPWSVMLKRAHGALTDAGCVVPLEFDQSIEHAIKDLARRATRAEQLFVDEYDARRDVERQRDELLRVNKGAAQHGIITEHVRELIELLGIQRQNPTANETVDAATTEIKTLRTTVEELKARVAVLEAMKPDFKAWRT